MIEKGLEPRSGRLGSAIDNEIRSQVLAIFEWPGFGAFLDEEVERIVHRHVGDDVDLYLQFGDEFGEDVAGEPVAVRILLVVHEVLRRRHLERMRNHAGAAVRGGAKANDLRPKRNGAVVFVMRQMVDGGADRHG